MACVGVSSAPDVGFEVPLTDLLPTSYNISTNAISQRITDPTFALLVPVDGFDRLLETGLIRYQERDRAVGIGFKCKIPNVFNTVLHNAYATTQESGFLSTPAFYARPFSDTDALLNFMDAMRVCTLATMQSFGDEGEGVVSGTVQTTSDTVAYIIHFASTVPRARLRAAAVHAIVTLTEHLADYDLEAVVRVDGPRRAAVGAPGDYIAPPDEREVYQYEYAGDDIAIKLIYDNKKTLFEMVVSAPPGEHFDVGQVTQITGAGRPRGASSASTPVDDATQEKLNRLLKMVKGWEPEITWKQDVVIGFVRGELGVSPTHEPVYDNKRWYSHVGMFRELCYSMGWKLRRDDGHIDNSYMLHTIISQTERERDRRVARSQAPNTPATPEQGIYNIQEEDEEEEEEPDWSTPQQVRRINLMGGWFDDEVTPELPDDAKRHIYSFLNPIDQVTASKINKATRSDVQPNIDRIKKTAQNAVQKSMLQHGGGYRNYLELKPPTGSWLSGVAFATSLEQSGQGALELNFAVSLPEGAYWQHSDFARFGVLGNAIRQPKKPLAAAETRDAVVAWVNAVFALARRYGVQVSGGHVADRAISFYLWSNKAATLQRDLVMQLQSHGWSVIVKHGRATLGVVATPHWVGAAFDELPPELKAHIIGRLAPRDRAAAHQLNHSTNALIKLGQHGNRLKVHESITADIAKKSFVTYELVPQSGTPAIIALSLQRPDAISLTIVTPYNNLIDYHELLEFGLSHRPNNVSLEDADEPLDEALQGTVQNVVSLFMGALALYKTRIHYSGVNTNYVSIWAQNRSRYRDIAARFVVDLAQQGWTVTKSTPQHEELVVEDYVGGIFEDDDKSDALPGELRSRIYSFMDMPALTNFQVTKPAFNKEVESQRWMMKHKAMDSLTKWFNSLDMGKRRFHLEYISGRRGVRELPKGVKNVVVMVIGGFSMSVEVELEKEYEHVLDDYIKYSSHATVAYTASHMRNGDASTVGVRGFIRFVCNQCLQITQTGAQTVAYNTAACVLTIGTYPLDTYDVCPLYAAWCYSFLSKGIELAVTTIEYAGGAMATSRKRPEPLYLPEYIEHQVEQSVQEEAKARGQEEPEDHERRVRQRLEGIFEEDEATPELGDDPQRKIFSYLDMASLTNLQATNRKFNTQIGLVKDIPRDQAFAKVLEWVTKADTSQVDKPTHGRWVEFAVMQHEGAKKLPPGVKSVEMKLDMWYRATVIVRLTERVLDNVSPTNADDLIRDLNDSPRPRYGASQRIPKPSSVPARRFLQWMLRTETQHVRVDIDAYRFEMNELHEKPEGARRYLAEVMYQLVAAGYQIGALFNDSKVITFQNAHGVEQNYWSRSQYMTRPLRENVHVPEELASPDNEFDEHDDEARRVRQRTEGIFEEDEATPELADDAQRRIISFLDMASLTNLQATGSKLNERIASVKHLAKDAVFPKILKWITKYGEQDNNYVTVNFVCNQQTVTRTGAKWLPGNVHSMSMASAWNGTELTIELKGEKLQLPRQRGGFTEWRASRLYETLQEGSDDDKQERAFFRATLKLCQELAVQQRLNIRVRTDQNNVSVSLRLTITFFTGNKRATYRAAAEFYYAMLTQGYDMAVNVVAYQEGLHREEFTASRREYMVPGVRGGVHLPEYVDGRPEPEPAIDDGNDRHTRQRVEGEMDDVINKLKGIKVVDEGHKKLVAKLARMTKLT